MKNKSHAITAQIEVPESSASVIISQGGAFGGLALYAKDGKLAYCYNLFGLERFKVYGADAVPAEDHQVRMEFTYDGGGLGKGGRRHALRRRRAGRRGARRRHRADALLGGRDDRRGKRHRDPGQRRLRHARQRLHRHGPRWVQLDVDAAAEDTDHLISPEERPGRDGETVGRRREARGPPCEEHFGRRPAESILVS